MTGERFIRPPTGGCSCVTCGNERAKEKSSKRKTRTACQLQVLSPTPWLVKVDESERMTCFFFVFVINLLRYRLVSWSPHHYGLLLLYMCIWWVVLYVQTKFITALIVFRFFDDVTRRSYALPDSNRTIGITALLPLWNNINNEEAVKLLFTLYFTQP